MIPSEDPAFLERVGQVVPKKAKEETKKEEE
jgi:hypothetical protein